MIHLRVQMQQLFILLATVGALFFIDRGFNRYAAKPPEVIPVVNCSRNDIEPVIAHGLTADLILPSATSTRRRFLRNLKHRFNITARAGLM
jgi:hypothetical protein